MDLLIILTFVGIIGLGFINGVSRVTAAILAIYFSSVFATAFYEPITRSARHYIVSMNLRTGELFFFTILFVLTAIVLTVAMSKWFGRLKMPRRLEIFDNVGGAALGIVVSGLAVTLAAMLLSIMLQALNQTVTLGGDSAFGWIHTQINHSALVPVFLRMAPFFVRMIEPWFPNGLPPILSGVPQG